MKHVEMVSELHIQYGNHHTSTTLRHSRYHLNDERIRCLHL